jgi:hypothetical protein
LTYTSDNNKDWLDEAGFRALLDQAGVTTVTP